MVTPKQGSPVLKHLAQDLILFFLIERRIAPIQATLSLSLKYVVKNYGSHSRSLPV